MGLKEFESLDWVDEERWELIEGVPCMSPSGTPEHQRLSLSLAAYLSSVLEPRGYLVLQDCDVRFAQAQSYFRPDISVFGPSEHPTAGELPISKRPTLVVEFLSPSTAANDVGPKHSVYRKAGVSEYWVVDPVTGAVMLHVLQASGEMQQQSTDPEGRVHSPLLNTAIRITRNGLTYTIAS